MWPSYFHRLLDFSIFCVSLDSFLFSVDLFPEEKAPRRWLIERSFDFGCFFINLSLSLVSLSDALFPLERMK